jgi:hypothetical protein
MAIEIHHGQTNAMETLGDRDLDDRRHRWVVRAAHAGADSCAADRASPTRCDVPKCRRNSVEACAIRNRAADIQILATATARAATLSAFGHRGFFDRCQLGGLPQDHPKRMVDWRR